MHAKIRHNDASKWMRAGGHWKGTTHDDIEITNRGKGKVTVFAQIIVCVCFYFKKIFFLFFFLGGGGGGGVWGGGAKQI